MRLLRRFQPHSKDYASVDLAAVHAKPALNQTSRKHDRTKKALAVLQKLYKRQHQGENGLRLLTYTR